MSTTIRFIASIAISAWGLVMVLLGLLNGFFEWIAIGLVVTGVGLPLFASNPLVAKRLYPSNGNIEGAAPPEPAPPPPSA